ncbi:hypothetical protein JOB18_030733 [Solea senegalensis]|uniref:SCL-interrupting locus protein n=1 Tax=Solea senegalensis TaxID=28829 RepID=A0AAV6SAQ8_SOLSE|nr:SCL-interrupting locus protein homolog isoform X2 [Solea senegalensis]KAG7514324.1 hypothetical protein JOB18_030733 [Solea senegalensis]
MSCPVKLQALPPGVFEEVFTPENVRGRTSTNSLSFPKSRLSLWDGTATGDKLQLQLCSRRKPRVVLLEKALRLAQRHVRHSNKRRLHCFFLGSVSVNADEAGLTVTLERFDPGRDQTGSSARVPSALLPGDILVPCVFSTEPETTPNPVVQSEAELHHCIKVLQQCVSSRQSLDLSQLIKVRGRVVSCQQCDAASFSLSWSAVCPSICMDVQSVRAVPIIPTALLRSLTGTSRSLQPAIGRQRGFLTMDQSRKLLLLLESDPKAVNLPLVGLWLSGVTHIYNPQVFACCLRFLFSSALQDRVLSESGCFLLVLFSETHRTPQFFQCRPGPGPGPVPGLPLDCELLTGFQSITLYQVAPVDGQTLQCELTKAQGRHMEIFRDAQSSFNSAPPSATGLSVSDQDSGVEDEDLSPRPSPSPHPPASQTRRVQPSVPELSLLIDSSFTSNHCGSTHTLAPDRKCAPPNRNTSSSSPSPILRPAPPPHLHSTPNPHLQQPCSCCSAHSCQPTTIVSSPSAVASSPTLPPTASSLLSPQCEDPSPPADLVSPSCLPRPTCRDQGFGQVGGDVQSDTFQLLLHQDRQLRLLQSQVQMLLEAQGKIQASSQQVAQRNMNSIAVGTGSSLFWSDPVQKAQAPPLSPSSCRRTSQDLSITMPVGGSEPSDIITHQVAPCSPAAQHSGSSSSSPADCPHSPQSVSMLRREDEEEEQQSFYHNLMTQLTTRLQESDSREEVKEEEEPGRRRRRSLSMVSDSSSSSWMKQQSPAAADTVVSATLRQLQQLGVDMDEVTESQRRVTAVESAGTLASISPAAVVSRLSVTDPSVTSLFLSSGAGSRSTVDLSLEANAIALRYLSNSQLSRLSLGGHTPQPDHASSTDSLLSPSNMSLATRKYMRRYGLIEEEEEEQQQKEVRVQGASPHLLSPEPLSAKLHPQSQLIRDLRPKMQVLSRNSRTTNAIDKENCLERRPSLVRASSHQTEASMGNILDLSRLRQLPKLF